MAGKTYRELRAELVELDAQIDQARARERTDAIATIHRLMDTYGIKHMELVRGPGSRGKYHTAPLPPKYRDPATGAEWAGRGNPPRWLRGKDRSRYLISPAVQPPKPLAEQKQ